MGKSREAISTIKGYYYQFDYYILQLLSLDNEKDSVCIEGIEDVDVFTDDEIIAVQCKYYEKTVCTMSLLGKTIRPMLEHFAGNKDKEYHYVIYGYYCDVSKQIKVPITLEDAKRYLFTYKKDKKTHILHSELNLSDEGLNEFLLRLHIKLDAIEYQKQIEIIITKIIKVFNCDDYTARCFYYNNAISFVKQISILEDKTKRKVTKKRFIEFISTKQCLFDKWLLEYKGASVYYKYIKKQFFSKLNVPTGSCFFLLECENNMKINQLIEILDRISNNWGKYSKRDKKRNCPYVVLFGLDSLLLIKVKRSLLERDFHIWDGYEFNGALFSAKSLTRNIDQQSDVKLRIINDIKTMPKVLKCCEDISYIYQFYIEKPFYDNNVDVHKMIQLKHTDDILQII